MTAFRAVARIVTVGVLMGLAGSIAAQQTYPNKPIRFIVPYPPGGTTTPLAHLIGQKLNESWGQPVIVDNRPGAATMVGTEALVKSAPDGYTIMLAGGSFTLITLLLPAPYDPIKDIVPVASLAKTEFVLLISPSVPANDLKELIAYAKTRPGQLNYATPGAGGIQHLAHEMLNQAAEIKTQHIPYKGASQALTDVVSGQVQMFFSATITAIPLVKAGRIKAIAVTGETRTPTLPQVPTFAEAGMSGFVLSNWLGVAAPAGTPKAIVDKLSSEIGRFAAMPDVKEKLQSQGLEPHYATPEQLAVIVRADTARYMKIIKDANIKIEN